MHGPCGGVEDLGERPAELEVEHAVGDVREEKGVLEGGREGGGRGGRRDIKGRRWGEDEEEEEQKEKQGGDMKVLQ